MGTLKDWIENFNQCGKNSPSKATKYDKEQ